MVFAVLKDEDAVVLQQLTFEDKVGEGRQFFQCVRRVCKDEVELLLARLDKAEHVAAKGQHSVSTFHL